MTLIDFYTPVFAPGLETGVLRIGFLEESDWNELVMTKSTHWSSLFLHCLWSFFIQLSI